MRTIKNDTEAIEIRCCELALTMNIYMYGGAHAAPDFWIVSNLFFSSNWAC